MALGMAVRIRLYLRLQFGYMTYMYIYYDKHVILHIS